MNDHFREMLNRLGLAFEGRWKSFLVEGEGGLLEFCRFVVLNPARTARVNRFGEYRKESI